MEKLSFEIKGFCLDFIVVIRKKSLIYTNYPEIFLEGQKHQKSKFREIKYSRLLNNHPNNHHSPLSLKFYTLGTELHS